MYYYLVTMGREKANFFKCEKKQDFFKLLLRFEGAYRGVREKVKKMREDGFEGECMWDCFISWIKKTGIAEEVKYEHQVF